MNHGRVVAVAITGNMDAGANRTIWFWNEVSFHRADLIETERRYRLNTDRTTAVSLVNGVNRHRCVSVGIILILSDPYNDRYEPDKTSSVL